MYFLCALCSRQLKHFYLFPPVAAYKTLISSFFFCTLTEIHSDAGDWIDSVSKYWNIFAWEVWEVEQAAISPGKSRTDWTLSHVRLPLNQHTELYVEKLKRLRSVVACLGKSEFGFVGRNCVYEANVAKFLHHPSVTRNLKYGHQWLPDEGTGV